MIYILRCFTSGESHGKGLIGFIEGFPSNVFLDIDRINSELFKRQNSYGRGLRMNIEKDKLEFFSGVRNSKTLGSPISFIIRNKDYDNWKDFMDAVDCDEETKKVTKPRPGHADLSGSIKYGFSDIRNVLERSSARETATRVGIGAICKEFLRNFNIDIASHVFKIGNICNVKKYKFDEIKTSDDKILKCLDETKATEMVELIDYAKENGDSLGGAYEIRVRNVPIGLGSYVHFDRKIDAILASSLISINSMKAIEFGEGLEVSSSFGSKAHDEIFYRDGKFTRDTNRAGGIEGGMTNGEEIVIRCYHKPIPTLYKPLRSVDIITKECFDASVERSDYTVVPAAAIVSENVVAMVIASEFLRKFSGDSIEEVVRNWKNSL